MSERAKLVKQLNNKGISVPKGAKVADLRHRVEHWLSQNGCQTCLSQTPKSPFFDTKHRYGLASRQSDGKRNN